MEAADATAPAQGTDRIDRGTVMALVAMACAIFVIANDFTALSIALPAMEKDFDADVSTVQWVINGYALVFGVLIVTGGRLADMFGRKRIFFVGAAFFAGFSVLGGAAQSADWLIICRALQGIGGALMWPAILGMVYGILPDSKHGLAGGLVIGVAGVGNAFGPILGGALTEASWRWIFFLNLPVTLIAVVVTYLKVHDVGDAPGRQKVDYAGVTTLSLSLIALLVALDQAPLWGWGDPRIVGLFVGCVVLFAAFLVIERRAGANALVPGDVMRNREFMAAALSVLMMSATFFAILVYVPQFLVKVLGYGPLKSGIGFLPMMGTFAVVSFVAGALYNRLGAKPILIVGAACLTAAPFLLSTVGADSGYIALVPGMVVMGFGVGLFYSTITTAGVGALDKSRASLAGGIVYMCQIAGGSVGLGLTTAIISAVAADHVSASAVADTLTHNQELAVNKVLAGTDSGQALLHQFPAMADELMSVAKDALVAGMSAGYVVVGSLAFVGFLIATFGVGTWRRKKAALRP
ncbi:MAG TPA: MFS transporter [Solirubrobacteraceae bacterium]|nr:MFS transporter [Solirubrobacteraceae bacterium]